MKRWKKTIVIVGLVAGVCSGYGCLKENVDTILPLIAAIAVILGVVGIVLTIKNH